MKKTITVPIAVILATVVLSLYQGANHALTGFDFMLFVCIFFLGMLANSGKEAIKPETEPKYKLTSKGELLLELGGFVKIFGDEEVIHDRYIVTRFSGCYARELLINQFGPEFTVFKNPNEGGPDAIVFPKGNAINSRTDEAKNEKCENGKDEFTKTHWFRGYNTPYQRQLIVDVYGPDFEEIDNPIGSDFGKICIGTVKAAQRWVSPRIEVEL